jgi:hypothetical protein
MPPSGGHLSEALTPWIGQSIVKGVTIDVIHARSTGIRSRNLAGSRPSKAPGLFRGRMALPLALAALLGWGGCKQPLVVGEYQCPARLIDGSSPPDKTDPILVPWATGFENQLDCDYQAVGGYCYGTRSGTARVVTSPVHSGDFAAEFTVKTGTDAGGQPQFRCYRQGVLPTEAYYGAWYYIPSPASNTHLWNLFHFRSGTPDSQNSHHGIWDVSLVNGPDKRLRLHVFDFLHGNEADGPPIPIGAWFHIVFYLKRAKDRTGEIALYQDGVRVVRFTNIITDDADWGQWYLGNLADALSPPESTVYVDDITITATP